MIKSNLNLDIIKDIKIRLANEKDIEDILNIEYDAFDKDIWENRNTFLERIHQFKDGFLIVLYKEKVVGYISSEIWNYKKEIKEEDFVIGHSIIDSHNVSGDELYISAFGILGEVRGLGLGNYVFDYFLEYISSNFKDIKSIILVVSESWKGALKIYENKGFKTVACIEDFFKYDSIEKYEIGIVMRKNIKK